MQLPYFQVYPLNPQPVPLRMHHNSRVHLLHHAVLRQKPHRLPHVWPPAAAHNALEARHHADADITGRRRAVDEVHRADQMNCGYAVVEPENLGNVSYGTAERPVSEDRKQNRMFHEANRCPPPERGWG